MLFWIIEFISDLYFFKFDLNYSVIFRGVFSLFCALFISLGIGQYVIKWLRNLDCLQSIRSDGPISHLLKQDTPTMGGIIMLISVIISILIWSDLSNMYVWYVLFIFVTYGILGLMDDLFKVNRKNSVGLSMLNKYIWQSLIAIILVVEIFISRFNNINNIFILSSCHNTLYQLNVWSMLLAYFVIVSASNSVNLSDGLDGLAIVPVVFVAVGLGIIAWITSNIYFSNYFQLDYIYHAKELVIICASIIGSGLGFLWFNTYPARIFMGDMGSLSFGGAIGVISVLLKQEYLLLIMGGVFVIETLSVILQIGFFKILKKRVFRMAPLHHHFELKGSPEPRIIVRFWIVSAILVLIGLMTLKMR